MTAKAGKPVQKMQSCYATDGVLAWPGQARRQAGGGRRGRKEGGKVRQEAATEGGGVIPAALQRGEHREGEGARDPTEEEAASRAEEGQSGKWR